MVSLEVNSQLITKQEAAGILKLSDSGVSFLSKRGDLPEIRLSRRRVFYDFDTVQKLAIKRNALNSHRGIVK